LMFKFGLTSRYPLVDLRQRRQVGQEFV
jgi:hypothetical protein